MWWRRMIALLRAEPRRAATPESACEGLAGARCVVTGPCCARRRGVVVVDGGGLELVGLSPPVQAADYVVGLGADPLVVDVADG